MFEILPARSALQAGEGRYVPSARGVAIGAAKIAAREAQKYLSLAYQQSFPLDRGEDLHGRGRHIVMFTESDKSVKMSRPDIDPLGG